MLWSSGLSWLIKRILLLLLSLLDNFFWQLKTYFIVRAWGISAQWLFCVQALCKNYLTYLLVICENFRDENYIQYKAAYKCRAYFYFNIQAKKASKQANKQVATTLTDERVLQLRKASNDGCSGSCSSERIAAGWGWCGYQCTDLVSLTNVRETRTALRAADLQWPTGQRKTVHLH